MRKWTAIVTMIALAAIPLAAAEDLWIHVRVDEGGERGETAEFNIPFPWIEQILPLVDHEFLEEGRLRLDPIPELGKIDLRGLLDVLTRTPDGEFVTLDDTEQKVRVAKENERLLVHVDEGDTNRIRLTLPMAVFGALASGEGEELDLLAALRELGRYRGDLVTVEEDGSHVRIWIDAKARTE
ncbi:MAG: hypothetical protein Q9Q40_01030 [Acidobacteriota bacterium]|nr:hypothetical protein [Acidobacteriota bacterium]